LRFHLAGDHQHQHIGRSLRHQFNERIGALLARRRIGHADFDDLAFGEQRHRAAVGQQRVPVETAFDDVQLTFSETLRSGAGTNGIGRFIDQ
jgi:hypothetical protein